MSVSDRLSRVPRPMLWVAAGLGVFGAANFAFLGLAGRLLGPADAAPVTVLWTLLNAVGIGLYLPLEQEIGRRLSASAAGGEQAPRLTRTLRYAGLSLLVIGLVTLVGHDTIATHLLSGETTFPLILAAGLLGQALAYLARGLLAGSGRFRRYGAQFMIDGALRTAGAALLYVAGVDSPAAFAWLLVVTPVVASVVTVPPSALVVFRRRTTEGGTGDDTGPSADVNLAPLVTASVTGQLLANAGPIAVAALATASEQALSGRFVAAVTIARIPLFLFAAVQAVFLPAMAALVARRDHLGFSRSISKALLATGALGLIGTAAVVVAGPFALGLVYGPEFLVGRGIMGLVAASGAFFMLAQVLALGLLAHHSDRSAAVGWAAGLLVLLVSLALPLDLLTRVSLALCLGSIGAMLTHAVLLRLLTQRWRTMPTNRLAGTTS